MQDDLVKIIDIIRKNQKEHILIAIDGRCAAGKTTLAKSLQKTLSCNVIHMDDFFLRPEQRTPQRLEIPGENIDHERFLSEVLLPIKENKVFSYRPYDCQTQQLLTPIEVKPNKITIAEGSYSCHPKLWDFYDIHVFADIDSKTQAARITARNGEQLKSVFINKWIPLEEKYFSEYKISHRCEIILK